MPTRSSASVTSRWGPGPRVLLLVALASLVAAGCDAPDRPPEPTTAGPVHQGGTAVLVAPAGLDAFNPLVTSSVYTQDVNRHLLFVPLLRRDAELRLQPALAADWSLEGDSAAVLELRDDVRWSDGSPTDAHDAEATLRRAMDPETGYPNAALFRSWTGVEALDDRTLRITFDRDADPLGGLTMLPVLPAHVLDTVPATGLRSATFNTEPITNGPFRLGDVRAGDRWVFEANPDFPEGLGGPPHLDRLVWRQVPDAQAREAEIRTGRAHIALDPRASRFDSLAAQPDITGYDKPSFRYTFIGWNHRRPPLDQALVRRALTRALDRPAILHAVRDGHGQLATGPVPPRHWAFDPTLPPLEHDPAAAGRDLRTAGFSQRDSDPTLENEAGQELRLQLLFQAGNDATRDLAQLIQNDLAQAGVHLELRPLDFNTLIQTITGPERAFDAVLLGLDADLRLDLRPLFHSGFTDGPFQLAGYANPGLDRLLDYLSIEADRRSTRPVWREVQRTLRDEQPWSFLYYYPELVLTRESLHGFTADLRGLLLSAPEWWLTPDPS